MNYETKIATPGVQPDGGDGAPHRPAANDRSADQSDSETLGEGSRLSGRAMAIIAVLVVLAGVIALIVRHMTDAAGDTGQTTAAQSVTVVVPGRTEVESAITASGVIGARRDLPVGIAGEGGKVVSVAVDAGTWVKAGQVLAVVDRSVQVQEIASQAANVQVQEANARLAQSKLDRSLKLVANGFISNADIEQLVATRDAAVAQVRVAKASLAQLQASTARLNVVAPTAGLVLTRGVEPGQIVGPSSGVLFRIAKDGELEMQARLSESNLARLHVGSAAEVTPIGTGRSFAGQVWQLAPTIDQVSREGIARIALAYDPALRPGGYASARLLGGRTIAPVLPESAILSDQTGAFVYVVEPDNKVSRRAVRIGDVTPQGIAVVQGLNGAEHVVLRAGGFLNAGDLVRPVMAGRNAPAPAR